jgi:hypothetical protein
MASVDDLRHGRATAALRAGVHPKPVQEVMRHSSYSTTADTYRHVMPAQSADAVRAVAALFERRPGSSFPHPESVRRGVNDFWSASRDRQPGRQRHRRTDADARVPR